MHFHSSIIVYTPVHCVLAVYTARPVYFMHDQCLSAVCFSPDIILRRLSCWIWRSMRGIHHPCSSCASKASLYGKIAGCVKCLQHSLTTCAFMKHCSDQSAQQCSKPDTHRVCSSGRTHERTETVAVAFYCKKSTASCFESL